MLTKVLEPISELSVLLWQKSALAAPKNSQRSRNMTTVSSVCFGATRLDFGRNKTGSELNSFFVVVLLFLVLCLSSFFSILSTLFESSSSLFVCLFRDNTTLLY